MTQWVAFSKPALLTNFSTDEVTGGCPVLGSQGASCRDSTCSKTFDRAIRSKRVKAVKAAFRAPNMNVYAERFEQTIKTGCLDHFIVFGLEQFDDLCKGFLDHYHTERSHQGLNNAMPQPSKKALEAKPLVDDFPKLDEINCRKRLVGIEQDGVYP